MRSVFLNGARGHSFFLPRLQRAVEVEKSLLGHSRVWLAWLARAALDWAGLCLLLLVWAQTASTLRSSCTVRSQSQDFFLLAVGPAVCVSAASISLLPFLHTFLSSPFTILLNPFLIIMPVIQRTAVRAASRSALRARQNAAALSTVARAAVNASSSVRAAAPKIAVAAVKPAVQGKFVISPTAAYISTQQHSPIVILYPAFRAHQSDTFDRWKRRPRKKKSLDRTTISHPQIFRYGLNMHGQGRSRHSCV